MLTSVEIKEFDDFAKYTGTIDPKGPLVLFYFSGSKLPNGNSWCPDCVEETTLFKNKHSLKKIYEMGKNKVTVYTLNNFDEFSSFVTNLKNKKSVFLLFFGKKKENGQSWCIYCQMAEPVVKAFLTEIDRDVTFVYVDVGDREYWKDRACPFRTDSRTKLMVIPTLIKWNGVQRLEGSQCCNRELLQMLFEDDD